MTAEENLQKYLSLIRKAAGWTAEDLGEKIGVTKQTISNIETGKSKLSKTQYLAIQMVISQKIATTPNDKTLADIMQLVVNMDEDKSINYEQIPTALELAAMDCPGPELPVQEKDNGGLLKKSGIAGALSVLGITPTAAVSATVLGLTLSALLGNVLNDEKE